MAERDSCNVLLFLIRSFINAKANEKKEMKEIDDQMLSGDEEEDEDKVGTGLFRSNPRANQSNFGSQGQISDDQTTLVGTDLGFSEKRIFRIPWVEVVVSDHKLFSG